MSQQIKVFNNGNAHIVNVNSFPDECGICHKNVNPIVIGSAFVRGDHLNGNLEVAFQCTNLKCNSLIIGYYHRISGPGSSLKLEKHAPINPIKREFDEEIKKYPIIFNNL